MSTNIIYTISKKKLKGYLIGRWPFNDEKNIYLTQTSVHRTSEKSKAPTFVIELEIFKKIGFLAFRF